MRSRGGRIAFVYDDKCVGAAFCADPVLGAWKGFSHIRTRVFPSRAGSPKHRCQPNSVYPQTRIKSGHRELSYINGEQLRSPKYKRNSLEYRLHPSSQHEVFCFRRALLVQGSRWRLCRKAFARFLNDPLIDQIPCTSTRVVIGVPIRLFDIDVCVVEVVYSC